MAVSPKFLLLQARAAADPMRGHERRCFLRRIGLPDESIVPHDLCAGPPRRSDLARFDALTVGGSGEFYVSRGNLPRFDAFLDFLREIVGLGFPTFSSCFGYQAMVVALGGRVVHDPEAAEVGTLELELTEDGRRDPLFGTLPTPFRAQLGHRDRATRLGDGVLNLAGSRLSPYQALRIPGKPIWATQFHPELDRTTNLDRFKRYIDEFAPDPSSRAAMVARFKESPDTSDLLRRFVEHVFGPDPAR